MRRIISLIVAGGLAASLLALASPAGAQTGDLAAMCQARIDSNQVESKKENLALMDKAVAAAPAAALPLITPLRDSYKKKGNKIFESPAGLQLIGAFDAYVYENCPGRKVPVSAIDYEFENLPASLPAGVAKFQLTNDAPKEDHEMALFKLTPEGAAMDPAALLAMPEKKVGRFVDFSDGAFMYAPAGQSGYAPVELKPGKYIYACFIPVGGKKKGTPHFAEGMYGTLTVA